LDNLKPTLPRHLIRISKDQAGTFCLYLIEPKPEESTPYAALSYAWGPPPHDFQTTIQNHLGRLAKIDFHNLPNTLKDAIIVTNRFGLQYLWVDALCIIQDDIKFKDAEIPKMAGIYKTAAVTILASRANAVQEGFLRR